MEILKSRDLTTVQLSSYIVVLVAPLRILPPALGVGSGSGVDDGGTAVSRTIQISCGLESGSGRMGKISSLGAPTNLMTLIGNAPARDFWAKSSIIFSTSWYFASMIFFAGKIYLNSFSKPLSLGCRVILVYDISG